MNKKINKYELQYRKETNDHPLKIAVEIYTYNYIDWLQDKLKDSDQEYIEACHKEINHYKKYSAHLADCDKTQVTCLVCEHNIFKKLTNESACKLENTDKCKLKKCSCGLE